MEVDYEDDSIDRWCVFHYRFDPERNEVRHVLLKAFSSRREMTKYFEIADNALQEQKKAGGVSWKEHISGHCLEAGYRDRARAAHILVRLAESTQRRRRN